MNPLRRLLPLSAALGLLALGATAAAQTQGYVQKTKTIRAAVLLLASDHPAAAIPQGGTTYLYPQTAAPFAFYNLDSVPGAKPDGWSFVNPYAAGVVTREIRRRYGEIYGVDAESPGNANPTTAFPVAAVDQPISKRHGPYWTVELSKLSETQIASYDILLVAPKYYLQLNSVERDRLRRFVDGGGVLWVDLLAAGATGGLFDPMNNLPVSLQPRLGVTGAAYRDVASPVLNGPRTVSDSDLYYLLEPGADARIYANAIEPFQPPTAPTPNFPSANFTSIIAEFFRYRNVASVTAGANTYPVIAEARLGDGAVVVHRAWRGGDAQRGGRDRSLELRSEPGRDLERRLRGSPGPTECPGPCGGPPRGQHRLARRELSPAGWRKPQAGKRQRRSWLARARALRYRAALGQHRSWLRPRQCHPLRHCPQRRARHL